MTTPTRNKVALGLLRLPEVKAHLRELGSQLQKALASQEVSTFNFREGLSSFGDESRQLYGFTVASEWIQPCLLGIELRLAERGIYWRVVAYPADMSLNTITIASAPKPLRACNIHRVKLDWDLKTVDERVTTMSNLMVSVGQTWESKVVHACSEVLGTLMEQAVP